MQSAQSALHATIHAVKFRCPLTGQTFSLQYEGPTSPEDYKVESLVPFRAPPTTGVSTVLHPLLTAQLHPTAASRLALPWQLWRRVYALAQAGWLHWNGVLALQHTPSRIKCLLVEQMQQLLAYGPRDKKRHYRLPQYRIEANATPDGEFLGDAGAARALLVYIANVVKILRGEDDNEFDIDSLSTQEENIQRIKEDVADRIARASAVNLSLRESVDHVVDVMEDLSACCGWNIDHTKWLHASLVTKTRPMLALLQLLRTTITNHFPQEAVIGRKSTVHCEFVMQHLDRCIVESANALAARAMLPEEEEEAAAAIASVRSTYHIVYESEEDALTDTKRAAILPVAHSPSKQARKVADALVDALRKPALDMKAASKAISPEMNTLALLALRAMQHKNGDSQ